MSRRYIPKDTTALCANYLGLNTPVTWKELELLTKIGMQELQEKAAEFKRRTEAMRQQDLQLVESQAKLIVMQDRVMQLKEEMTDLEYNIEFTDQALRELEAKVDLLEECVTAEEEGYCFQRSFDKIELLKVLDDCDRTYTEVHSITEEMADFVENVQDVPRCTDTEMKLLEAHLNLAEHVCMKVEELDSKTKQIDTEPAMHLPLFDDKE